MGENNEGLVLSENRNIIVEEMVVGNYSELFKKYILEKVKRHTYPDKEIRITKTNLEGKNEIIDLENFLKEKKQKIPETRIFTKDELLDDFFQRIKMLNDEKIIRDLAKTAFAAFGEQNMSEHYLDNIKKNPDRWPESIRVMEKPGPMDERIETSRIVIIPCRKIIEAKI
jgi:hypothetical protein